MRILFNPHREGQYLFDFPDKVLRVYFLLKQIDIVDKNSFLFKKLNIIYESIPLSISEEEAVFKRTKELVSNISLRKNFNCYRNIKNNRFFLVGGEHKFLEVDTELNGITDKTEALFWQNHYNLKKPERSTQHLIDSYKKIQQNFYELIQATKEFKL